MNYKYTFKDRLYDFLMLVVFALLFVVFVLFGTFALFAFALPIALALALGNATWLLCLFAEPIIVAAFICYGKWVFDFYDMYC